MDAKSDFLEDNLLNHVLRNVAYTSPTNVFIALYTVIPTDSTTGTEVANSFAYARQAVTFGAPSSGTVANSGTVTFPQASGGAWGTIVAMAITDNSGHGAGNILYYGALSTPKVVGDGDQISFANGALTIAET